MELELELVRLEETLDSDYGDDGDPEPQRDLGLGSDSLRLGFFEAVGGFFRACLRDPTHRFLDALPFYVAVLPQKARAFRRGQAGYRF